MLSHISSILREQLHVLAVENCIGELFDPVTKHCHGPVSLQSHLPCEMDMSKHIMLDFGVLGAVLAAELLESTTAHLLDLVFLFLAACHTVVLRPRGGNGKGPSRMNTGIEPLAHWIIEAPPREPVHGFLVPNIITVRQKELRAHDVHHGITTQHLEPNLL